MKKLFLLLPLLACLLIAQASKAEDYEAVFSICQPLAKQGDVKAQYNLVRYHDEYGDYDYDCDNEDDFDEDSYEEGYNAGYDKGYNDGYEDRDKGRSKDEYRH